MTDTDRLDTEGQILPAETWATLACKSQIPLR